MGQMTLDISSRAPGTLPSNTKTNPKEQEMAISILEDEKIEDPFVKAIITRNVVQLPEITIKTLVTIMNKVHTTDEKQVDECEQSIEKNLKENTDNPQAQKLHINIPFIDAIRQIPSYAKFLKDMISRKRKLLEFETVALIEESGATLQKKLPPKLKDPGRFTLPISIGEIGYFNALYDTRAIINLIPLSVYRKLGLGEGKETSMSLQLADRSIKHQICKVEYILIKVGKLIFPANFIVLDMEEDKDIPII
ncbi:uncharacterized protein LOC111371913 [Olea europaea var. sylvestris]|uniref:uncharacterized protein LOC111371913 n=1 Tax=Olea europaea var. sylvestris TaxID=158386 RepID=UPI000C1D5072|nr:uncharacterized protein LOC111371913 [Olea europaea var. sylvestris]